MQRYANETNMINTIFAEYNTIFSFSMRKSILYRKIYHKTGESFSYDHNSPFTMPLHAHEEYELIYIISGNGKEYIADAVMDYHPGDLTLIGRNVAHLHLCNSCMNKSKIKSSCHILQFPISIFPSNLSDIQEFYNIKQLLEDSLYGIRFQHKETTHKIQKMLCNLNQAKSTERIIILYKILDLLSKSSYKKMASPANNYQSYTLHPNDPIEKGYAYIRSHFNKSITLNDISSSIGQTPTSTCRLFKLKTGKTLFTILNEIRIEHACRLLAVSNLSNTEIAYACGFNNLSYFNKVFKTITRQTPTEYRQNLMYHFHNPQ